MAGPLSAIAESGGCEYVYPRDDWYFASVNDPQRAGSDSKRDC